MTTAAMRAEADRRSDTTFYLFNGVVSLAALGFLGWLLVLRRGGAGSGVDLRFLPAVNASLNGTAGALLAIGWIAIKRKNVRLHKFTMVSAFAASALFFVCYAIYHYAHGDTRYQGEGAIRAVYFAILISHIVLSASVPPLALTSFYFAWRKRFATHKKVTRITVPIWLYVSVTGVIIFFMLRGSAPAVP
jgi:putative membrane protein